MNALKISVCWLLTISISGVFMAPPRNVIQMEEKAEAKPPAAPVDSKTTLKIALKPPEGPIAHPKNVPEEPIAHPKNVNVPEKPIAHPENVNVEEKSKKETLHSHDSELTQKRLSVEDLKPADHLDAVKLEQDGMINKDYKKEIFLGNHEEIEDDRLEVAESKLKEIFLKVDEDRDQRLCMKELESWIIKKTQEHFDEAKEENDHIFKQMDPNGTGFVDWKDYYVRFLLAKGYPLDRAKRHIEDYDEIKLDYEEREQLIKYKFRWTDADQAPLDNKLTQLDFLAFRHPEQSAQALLDMVKTIVDSLDQNDDKVLTEDEFVSLPLGDVDDEEHRRLDKEWQKERGDEFKNQIDFDHNGKVTIEELKTLHMLQKLKANNMEPDETARMQMRSLIWIHAGRNRLKRYLDPRNPDNAKSDTKMLIQEMDDNKDECISWTEIEDHKDMFIQSKIVNMRRILHDEF